MDKLMVILFSVSLLIASGCSEKAKKQTPASTAPAAEQGQDQHVSGDETSMESETSESGNSSENHLSGTASDTDSHVSGN